MSSSEVTCSVYETSDFFTVLVQLWLGLVGVGGLLLKRHTEIPRRPLFIWCLDSAKVSIGCVLAHVMNLVIAKLLAAKDSGFTTTLKDECAWYAICSVVDTTLGLLVSVLLIYAINRFCAGKKAWAVLTGDFTEDIARRFSCQLLVWVIVLIITKLIVLSVSWAAADILAEVGIFLFGPLQSAPHAELVMVMLIIPSILNLVYFWVVDSWLSAAESNKRARNATTSRGGDLSSSPSPGVSSAESQQHPQDPQLEGRGKAQDGSSALYLARNVMHISDHVVVCGGNETCL